MSTRTSLMVKAAYVLLQEGICDGTDSSTTARIAEGQDRALFQVGVVFLLFFVPRSRSRPTSADCMLRGPDILTTGTAPR